VLDLSRIMAGPWMTQILADLGADVIKVERAGPGDDTRTWGPPFLPGDEGREDQNSGYYLCVNRGKRSITANLRDPDDLEMLRTIAKEADVVVENFKVGTLARFGLDYDSLSADAPGLIYCSITGFGQDGPRAAQPAYDFCIQAMGGIMSVTGRGDNEPGGGPQKVGVPIVDIMTGMYSAIAVLAALERRRETGKGDYIDLAMLDVQTAFLANQGMNYLLSGKVPVRTGNKHPNIQPQDVFQCKDAYIALAVGNDGQFRKLCDVIGQPELGDDERFRNNAARVRNLPELREILCPYFETRDAFELATELDAAGVPAGRINTIDQVLEEEQIVHRQMVRELKHSRAGTVKNIVSPMRFRNAPLEFERAAPLLGEHTDEVKREFGIGSGESDQGG
jgi:crotonobetainyl-CoA:carnitine CoA-transferase CaiB-like acyl-CoA transferase